MIQPTPSPSGPTIAWEAVRADATRVAKQAAHNCGVLVDETQDPEVLRAVSSLLESVWGRTSEGVPIATDVMRGLVHAGGCVTTARDSSGNVVGAAVLAPARDGAYSLITATATGQTGRGLGRALKLRQRAWALDHGWRCIQWTFDPLVSRNARFNLSTLGALATAYEQDFYGQMCDDINADDVSDRLVAVWNLDDARATAAAQGQPPMESSPPVHATLMAQGPDGYPLTLGDKERRWCRVPKDILTLRREQPDLAHRWRAALRMTLSDAFTEGFIAVGFSHDGWYTLDRTVKAEQ